MSKHVSCINKTHRMDPHDRIHSIGGPGWRITQTQAIADIERDPSSYYVNVSGVSVWVIVADHNGNKYIKTHNDGVHPNNLLSLPECLG
jgi:hypothetical protein